MKRTALLALAFTLVASQAFAQSRTFYDSSGRVSGRSATDSQGTTTFYDANGRTSARSQTSGNQTTIYDATGRALGRSTTTSPKGAGYYGPGYGYYDPGYAVTPGCYWQRQRFWDGFGWRLRNARVCVIQ